MEENQGDSDNSDENSNSTESAEESETNGELSTKLFFILLGIITAKTSI